MFGALRTGKSLTRISPWLSGLYEAITVDGVTEIIEHRKMEPIFFVTDDPAVRKQIAEIGCVSTGEASKERTVADFLQGRAVSTGRCNTGLEFTRRSFKAQGFSWALI
jgi:hypothetical protein